MEANKEEQEFKMIFPLKMILLGNNTVNHLIFIFISLISSNIFRTIPSQHLHQLELFFNHKTKSICINIEMVDSVTLSVPGDRSRSLQVWEHSDQWVCPVCLW